MDTAKDNGSATVTSDAPQCITTQRVSSVHANAHHMAVAIEPQLGKRQARGIVLARRAPLAA